jgi:hypothetical protein
MGRVTDAAFRMSAHDAYDLIEKQFNEALDVPRPLGPEVLYDHVAVSAPG